MRRILQAALLCIAALLTGCATTRVVDSDVQAFSTIQKVGEPATFRFERLPSQQAHPQDQAALEAIAKASLARVGLTVDEANARFSVQVDANVQRVVRRDLWNDPWHNPWGGSWGHPWGPPGWHGPHRYFGSPFWGPTTAFPEPDLFMHEVHIVMRDLGTQQIVFESRATHESLAPGDAATLGAMFDAALKDFPLPPQGPRRLRIEIAPAGAPKAAG
jgi:predicted small secreted protein